MARPHKIKHYHRRGGIYKARPHPVTIVLWILGVGMLVFVGISSYQPIYNLITGEHSFFNRGEVTLLQPEIPLEPVDVEEDNDEQETPAVRVIPSYRSIYLPTAIVSDSGALSRALDNLPSGIDSIMIDLKDNTGTVLFNSQNTNANAWNAVSGNAVDLPALAEELDARDLKLIGRITTFRDEIAARGNRDNAVRYQGSNWLWLDNAEELGGKPWLSPMAEGARQYIIDLAVEASQAGVSLIVMESVQFAENSSSPNASFGAESGAGQRQATLREFVAEATNAIESAGGFIALYYPVTEIASAVEEAGWAEGTLMSQSQTRYGGNPLEIVGKNLVLGVLPYQFGASAEYDRGGLKLKDPVENPVSNVGGMVLYVQQLAGEGITLIPLMQGGFEPAQPSTAFTNGLIESKIEEVRRVAGGSHILYQTEGNYGK